MAQCPIAYFLGFKCCVEICLYTDSLLSYNNSEYCVVPVRGTAAMHTAPRLVNLHCINIQHRINGAFFSMGYPD